MISYIATPTYGHLPGAKPSRRVTRRLRVYFVIQRVDDSTPATWTYIAEFDDFATALAVRDDLNRSVGVP
jgi:hypothetical protein